jgi:hypothetical protein
MDHQIKVSDTALRKIFELHWHFHEGDSMVTNLEFPVLALKENHIENDLFVVQIMKSKGIHGWLYDKKISYIFVQSGDITFFLDRMELQQLTESCLKEKKWCSSPEKNKLMEIEGGTIIGFIPIEKLKNI